MTPTGTLLLLLGLTAPVYAQAMEIDNLCADPSGIEFDVSHNYGWNGITKVFSEEAITSEVGLPIASNGGTCAVATPEFRNNTNAPRGYWLEMTQPGTSDDTFELSVEIIIPKPDNREALSVFTGACGSLECVPGQEYSVDGTKVVWTAKGNTTYKILVSVLPPLDMELFDEHFAVIAKVRSPYLACLLDLPEDVPNGDYNQECICEATTDLSYRKVCRDLCDHCYLAPANDTGAETEFCFRRSETNYYGGAGFDTYGKGIKEECLTTSDGFTTPEATFCFTHDPNSWSNKECILSVDGQACSSCFITDPDDGVCVTEQNYAYPDFNATCSNWESGLDINTTISSCNRSAFDGALSDYEIILDLLAGEANGEISASPGFCLNSADLPSLPDPSGEPLNIQTLELGTTMEIPDLAIGEAVFFDYLVGDVSAIHCVMAGGSSDPDLYVYEDNPQGGELLCSPGWSDDGGSQECTFAIDASVEYISFGIKLSPSVLTTSVGGTLLCQALPEVQLGVVSDTYNLYGADEEDDDRFEMYASMDLSAIQNRSVACYMRSDSTVGTLEIREEHDSWSSLCYGTIYEYNGGVAECIFDVPNTTDTVLLELSSYETSENITVFCQPNYDVAQELELGVASDQYDIAENETEVFLVKVPARVKNDLLCEASAADGDLDLYLNIGRPSLVDGFYEYNCGSLGLGSTENCTLDLMSNNTYFASSVYVVLNAYAPVTGAFVMCDLVVVEDASVTTSKGNPDLP